jgi:hypothetical protein
MHSIDEGIQIDESEEHLRNNARSRLERGKPDSNVIVAREVQRQKEFRPRFATEEGIQIVNNDEL